MSDVTITPATQSRTQADRAALTQDFDQFLRLLTTQLQNQDPLSPLDSNEFTNQLVQFSSVEQSIKTNEHLESLLATQTLNLTALGLSFIGKDVEIPGNIFKTDGTKGADLAYETPEGATNGTISILNEDGTVVYTSPPDLSPGRHEFVWDGKDENGNIVPAGNYEIRIALQDAEKRSLNTTTFIQGFVESLESADNGDLLLIVNDQKISLADVRKVSVPGI